MSVESIRAQLKILDELIYEQRNHLKNLFLKEEQLKAELLAEQRKEEKSAKVAKKDARGG